MNFDMPKLRKLISRLHEELPAKEDNGESVSATGAGAEAPANLLSRIIDEEEDSDAAR